MSEQEGVLEDPKKIDKIEKEKKSLLSSLASGDFSKLKTRVAYILNLYPKSRDSDVFLTLKYWEIFQPDMYNPAGTIPKDLFRLERMHYIVRARAKIQNEYNLFPPSSEVGRFRKKNEENIREEVILDAPPRKVVNIFSDETGKMQDYVIVSSVWVLTGRAVFTVSQEISNWKEQSKWKNREIHFARFGKQDIKTLEEYLEVIVNNREYLSFKTIAVEKAKTKRSIEEVVKKLHEYMLIRGIDHEVNNNRIRLPQKIEMTMDEEQSLDAISLEEMRRRINLELNAKYGNDVELEQIQTVCSKNSPLIQLSDLVAGAIGRKLNHKGVRNFKDEMSDMVIEKLELKMDENEISELDMSALFKI